jgi:alpha-1,2-mannosyltransferase
MVRTYPKIMNKKNLWMIVLFSFIGVLLILNFSALYINWWPSLSGQWGLTHKVSRVPIGGDFSVFYAASELILSGKTSHVYDPSVLRETIEHTTGAQRNFLWHYPPIFLLIVSPLALLPYLPSLFMWLALTLGGYLWVIRRIAPHPITPWLALAFPGAYINFIHGQNGFLTAIILAGGLLLLDRKPRLAGLVLGLLCYKAHFAALVPVALLAGRRWQALAMAAFSAAALAAVSLLAFGPEAWRAFFASIDASVSLFQSPTGFWRNSPTAFVATRLYGGSLTLAWTIQALVMLLAVSAVVYAWSGYRKIPSSARNATLVLAALLFTPYAHSYDFAILALPLAWLGWEYYRRGLLPYFDACLLIVGYVTPFLVYPFGEVIYNFPLAPLVFIILMINALSKRYDSQTVDHTSVV